MAVFIFIIESNISNDDKTLIVQTYDLLTRLSYRTCISMYLKEYELCSDINTITKFLNQQSTRVGERQLTDYKTAFKKFFIPIIESSSINNSNVQIIKQFKSFIKSIRFVEQKEQFDSTNDREVLNYMYSNLIYYGLLSSHNEVNQIMLAF